MFRGGKSKEPKEPKGKKGAPPPGAGAGGGNRMGGGMDGSQNIVRTAPSAPLVNVKLSKGLRGVGLTTDENGIINSIDPQSAAGQSGDLAVGDQIKTYICCRGP